MSMEPNLAEQRLLDQSFGRDETPMARREAVAEAAVASGFIAVVVLLWLAFPVSGDVKPLAAGACAVGLAFAVRVRFHVAAGFTVPTQLFFVPLLFTLPAQAVPVAVAVALVLARIPEVLTGRWRASRLVPAIANSSFTLGPAVMFSATGDIASATPAILVAALFAQFLADFLMSALREAIVRGATVAEQLREWWVYAVDAGLTPAAFAIGSLVAIQPGSALSLLPLLALFAVFSRERESRLKGLLELSNAYHGTALVLGDVIEADDGYTGEHSKSVVELALSVGEQLGLSADRQRNLEFGALLHDVGKIAIPKSIINKPGKLDPAEWSIIKTHTLEGQRILDRVGGFMRDVGLIVRSHHERWDAAGYPDRLAGEAIPLEARIISCCDSWNAMTTTRSYRAAMPRSDAMRELRANAGSQFDPAVIEALVEVLERDSAVTETAVDVVALPNAA